MAVHRTINLFNRFCSLFLPTLLHRKTPLKSLGILAQSPSDVLSLSAEHWNGMIQNENLSKLYHESNGNGINIENQRKWGMCYSLIAPFFAADSIHLSTMNAFNLFLPNPAPLEDMLDLIESMTNSDLQLIKLRLELPPHQRYKKTKVLLESMAKFVGLNPSLNELHLHLTKTVNGTGIKKLFQSVRDHPNLVAFEMSEIQVFCVLDIALDVGSEVMNKQVEHYKFLEFYFLKNGENTLKFVNSLNSPLFSP